MTSAAVCGVLENALSGQKTKNIFRAPHDKTNPYALISNKLLRDTTIKHSDRGLLCQILSWSDYHNVCIQAIAKKSLEGRDAIRKSIDRLIAAGYIRVMQTRSVNGQFDTVTYQIFEQSTGAVVADLDLSGISDDMPNDAQLSLFEDDALELPMNSQNIESVNLSANGKTVSGKHDTNNNHIEINTDNSNNAVSENGLSEIKTKADVIRLWPKSIDDPILKARICMAGLQLFISTQQQLDQYLADFNLQHDKYKHLSENQRLNNFLSYLCKMRHTPAEHKKHLARLRAHGFYVAEVKAPKATKQSDAITRKQNGVNPFNVVESGPVIIDKKQLDALEGF